MGQYPPTNRGMLRNRNCFYLTKLNYQSGIFSTYIPTFFTFLDIFSLIRKYCIIITFKIGFMFRDDFGCLSLKNVVQIYVWAAHLAHLHKINECTAPNTWQFTMVIGQQKASKLFSGRTKLEMTSQILRRPQKKKITAYNFRREPSTK